MKLVNAQLHWSADGLPRSTDYDDVYFSRDDAVGERQHVFLAANRLRERWQALPPGSRFTLAELGFGSGLNCLQTVRLWSELPTSQCHLHYLAFEKHPLTRADLARLHALWPECSAISQCLLLQYPEHTAGCHRLRLAANVILDLYYGDALTLLQDPTTFAHSRVDCWYLDGFSPARNPALWQPDLLQRLAALSAPGTTLSTYSVAGRVRQGLVAAGFAVDKLPGFGRKREMLFAALQGPPPAPVTAIPPWQQLPAGRGHTGHAIVIGAGLAGCSTAHSLAARGWQVTVLESSPTAATGASGIPQLALRCRQFRQSSPAADFFTLAFIYAHRHYQHWQARSDIGWHATGVIQTDVAMQRQTTLDPATLETLYAHQVISPIAQSAASALAGLALASGGYWQPLGGWLQAELLCGAWLEHPAIRLQTDCIASGVQQQEDGRWQVLGADPQHILAHGDVVVICNAGAATALTQSSYLPLTDVRGQTSSIAATASSSQLRVVVNGERTVFPAYSAATGGTRLHTLAASYTRDNTDIRAQVADEQANLMLAATNFSDPQMLAATAVDNAVAFRCTSPDRLPVVGPLANATGATAALAALGRNASHRFATTDVDLAALYHAGLYINVAHGSNGLATCPLAAELIASMINNENLPCTGAVAAALNPIRFLVRDLKKQRISVEAPQRE